MTGALLVLGIVLVLAAAAAAVARQNARGRRPARGLLVALAVLGILLTTPAAVSGYRAHHRPAAPPPPAAHLRLSPDTVPVGASYVISGGGFAAGERVRVTWVDRDVGGSAAPQVPLGETTADANGEIIPLTVKEAATPTHYTIRAAGLRSGRAAASVLTVTN